MKLLVIVLNKVEYLKDILSIMAELEISDATIIDSQGMTHALAHDVPIFAGLQKIVGEAGIHSKTIFALIDDDSVLVEFDKILKEEEINLKQEDAGIMFTVSVGKTMR